MPGSYVNNRYVNKNVAVVGTSPRKKYLIIFGLILLAGCAGIAYLIHTSGILAESNPDIAPHLMNRINIERQAAGLQPVQEDSGLSGSAATKSLEAKRAAVNYASGTSVTPDAATNVLVVSKASWALSGRDFQQVFGSAEMSNTGFLENVQNPGYRTIGIGIASDSYNYYIVTTWKE